MSDLSDWALTLKDENRTATMLMYTAPDGRRYVAPLGTSEPDPDRALGPAWLEIEFKCAGAGA